MHNSLSQVIYSCHSKGNYVTDKAFHTNNIDNFRSLLKRGLIGIYHNVGPKHLHRYCNEFGFRYIAEKSKTRPALNYP
jgi:hypothetical protein